MNKKLLTPLMAALVGIVMFILYMTTYEYVVYFQEQHHLFRFTWAYISELIHMQGILYCLAEFVVQFGYYTWLGALIWTLLGVSVYLMWQNIILRLFGKRDMIQLSMIPTAWMFFDTVSIDIFPSRAMGVLVVTFGMWILAMLASVSVGTIRKRFEAAKSKDSKLKWQPIVVSAACAAAIFGIGYYNTIKPRTVTLPSGKQKEQTSKDVVHQRDMERVMINAERALKEQDWDKVYELVSIIDQNGEKNHLTTYFRSMALYHKGMLLTNLFDYPQTYGVNALYFPWQADRNRAEYGGYVYEQLGLLNSANHWAFEALVGWGETANHLTNLARYSIAGHKPEQARKFIAPLKRTLFYRGVAKELEQMLAEGEVPGLKNSVEHVNMPQARWDNVINLGSDLRYLLEADPQNDMAKQYMMAHLLLANNLGAFYRNMKDFWPQPKGEYLPPIVEQALCIVRMQIGSEALAGDGYTISPKTDAMFREFVTEQQKGDGARYSSELRKTYWYYVQKISPYGRELQF